MPAYSDNPVLKCLQMAKNVASQLVLTLELPSLLHISDEISLKSLNVAKTQK